MLMDSDARIYVVNCPFILFCYLESPCDEERFRGTFSSREGASGCNTQ